MCGGGGGLSDEGGTFLDRVPVTQQLHTYFLCVNDARAAGRGSAKS